MSAFPTALSYRQPAWKRLPPERRVLVGVLVVVMILASAALVYLTGGIKYVYSHSMYLAILLGAFAYGMPGGLVTALAGGLLLGPWMPVDTLSGEMQQPVNWLLRLGMFLLVGGLAGAGVQRLTERARQLAWVAYHDPATGLPGRAWLEEALRGDPALAVVVLRLENLDELNNTFGVGVADELIRQAGERLRERLPQSTGVFQKEGNKLALTLPDRLVGEEPALVSLAAAALRAPFLLQEVPVHVTAHAGLARVELAGEDPLLRLRRAGIAAYQAHTELRDLHIYTPSMDSAARETQALLGELGPALEHGELRLHYQPKVRLATGAVEGAEALLRWQHPRVGLVPPGRFIGHAEQTTLINPITHWVIEAALRQLAEWRRAGLDMGVAVNLSTRNFSDPELAGHIHRMLEATGVPGGCLELEVTESAMMLNPDRAAAILSELGDTRVTISIDDFGTGYSSLAYLDRLPAACIKVDQSFVQRVETDNGAREIVRAAAAMAHAMGMEVVAEGVENARVLDLVTELGCDLAQGFHLCRPLPAPECRSWMEQPRGFPAAVPQPA